MMNKVNVYLFDTRKCTLSELVSFANLSEEDLKSLERFRNIEIKKEKLISLYLKRKYVGEFNFNEHGKPISGHCYFNISHSRGVVVLAINQEYEIGVDIEVIKSADKDLIKYVSNDEELEFIKNEFDFLSIWTNKESLVKCFGTGIKHKIKSIPALPLNGKKEFEGKAYFSKIIKANDAIISITIQNENDFECELITETL